MITQLNFCLYNMYMRFPYYKIYKNLYKYILHISRVVEYLLYICIMYIILKITNVLEFK